MADENKTADPQAGEASDKPQGQEPTTSTNPQAGEVTKPSKSAEDYERMIEQLRKENAGHRTRLKTFEEEEQKRKDAELSERERLEKQLAREQKERADYVARTQDRLVNAEIRSIAAKLGFTDPADAVAMLSRADLEFDDDGTPTNAETLLQALLKAKPYLAGQQQTKQSPTSGGATNPPRSQSGSGEITAAYVADVMSGKIPWRELSQAQRTAILDYQAKNPYRF